MSEKNQIPWEREVIERLLQERLPCKRYRWLKWAVALISIYVCLLYTSPSPRDS